MMKGTLSPLRQFLTTENSLKIQYTYLKINISRSTGNQAMTFGQLIEFNMWNFFLEKSNTKCDGERGYLWINSLKFYTVSDEPDKGI